VGGKGGGGASAGSAGAGASSCKAVTAGPLTADTLAGWLVGPLTGGSGAPLTLHVQLEEIKGTKLAPGTFDLAKEPSYGEAVHAVLVTEGDALLVKASKAYFQASGSMTLDKVSSPPTAESKGALASVVVVESKIDSTTFASTPVSGGGCLVIATAAWDTTVSAGTKCQTADDCGDPSQKVCDPKTGTCAAIECTGMCPAGGVCFAQSDQAMGGACYTGCSGGVGCAATDDCVYAVLDQSASVCKKQGAGADGTSCKLSDIGTSCDKGLVCALEEQGNVCRKACDFWALGACPSGQHCVLGSSCSSAPIDPAKLDASCDASSQDGTPCGLDAKGPHGLCVAEPGAVMCRKPCRQAMAAMDCPMGKTCDDYLPGVGVCR
jgi:hypothetical protein